MSFYFPIKSINISSSSYNNSTELGSTKADFIPFPQNKISHG